MKAPSLILICLFTTVVVAQGQVLKGINEKIANRVGNSLIKKNAEKTSAKLHSVIKKNNEPGVDNNYFNPYTMRLGPSIRPNCRKLMFPVSHQDVVLKRGH